MMIGNHRTSCTFTVQQIGRWLLHTDSNFHGHRLANTRKQFPLLILKDELSTGHATGQMANRHVYAFIFLKKSPFGGDHRCLMTFIGVY